MTDHDVVIAGGGPCGLMLAAELALAGVDAAVVERRPSSELVGSRAGGFHARTLEIFDMRGIVDRFLAEGQTAQAHRFGTTELDISDFPTRHPYSLGIWQNKIESVLAGWVGELPAQVLHGREFTGLTQHGDGVELHLADGKSLRAQYLVGCDGGRSLIRKAAGIGFPGLPATKSNLVAEVEVTEEPPKGVRHDATGVHGLHRMENGTVRVVTTEQTLREGEATLADLSTALLEVYGTDFGVHSPTWVSRFTDATRQAENYRSGRVFLAGDAAHTHSPAGGQGIGLGVQDAVNLGWKLGQVLRGASPDSLLDTYHAERHPAGARALGYTVAQSELQRPGERNQALLQVVSPLGELADVRRQLAGALSGLDLRYDLGESHPLLGRRMPDLDLGSGRVYALLRDARPLLLTFDGSAPQTTVRTVTAAYAGAWELPVLGPVSAPTAVLIRPDGYVAWVGEGSDAGLSEAVSRWF